MKTLIIKVFVFLFVIVWPFATKSQIITTTAASITSCPGEIQVPLIVSNCNNIAAISLVLNFDNTNLSYLGYQQLNTLLNGGLLIINSLSDKVVISWINSTPINPGNDTLLKLRFNAISSSCNITWNTQTLGNCEYSDINGSVLPANFVDAAITINQIPYINAQPIDKSVLVGQNTSFSVEASGTTIAYLWQISTNGGSVWADLSDDATYSGASSENLNISNALLTYNSYKYRCRLTGICSPVIFSDPKTLTVINPITTTLPVTSTCPGNILLPVTVNNFNGVAAFSLILSYNTSNLIYTGYQNLNGSLSSGNFAINSNNGKIYMTWSSITAASFANDTLIRLMFTATTGSSNLNWDLAEGSCEYSSLNGSIFTSVLINGNVNIYSIPAIISHPLNKTIAKGQSTTFSVDATGTGLSYLWQLSTNGGVNFSDLTNSGYYSNVSTTTLTITAAQLSINAYQYRCKVSGSCTPVVYSNPALLKVLPNVITNCPTITQCPGQLIIPISVTDFIGIASFSMTLNFNSSVLTYNTYQNLNTAIAGGILNINSSGDKLYLSWSNTTAATIANGSVLVELKFNSIPGSSSLNWDTQSSGNCEYSDINGQVIFSTWNNGNVTINLPPNITIDPVNKSIYASGSTSFSVTATGTNLAYRWQLSTNNGTSWANLSNTTPYSGVNSATLSINPAAIGMNNYQYRSIVSGTCTPSDTSSSCLLTITQSAIYTSPGAVSNSCTGNINIPINVTNCNNVASISLTIIYDTTVLTFEGYHSLNSSLSGGICVVNRFANKVYLSWASTTAASIGTGTLIQYRFRANAGTSTTISWDIPANGACEYTDPSGNIITSFYNNANITVTANPLIVNAGNDACISSGGNLQLNASVSGGTAPYTYIWSPSTGLNNSSILNPIASPASTTIYTLTVTGNNACSGTDQININVNNFSGAAGTISGPATVFQGQSNVNFTVPLISNATSYVWTLPAGANIVSGYNTNSIMVSFSNNAVSGYITVFGSNICGNGTTSPEFLLTLNPLPCTPPSIQATAITFSEITTTTMTLGWTRGNGDSVLVIARQGSAVNADPVSGNKYYANHSFSYGTQIGSGNYVIYAGTGTSVNITELSTETNYYFAVYEYNNLNTCYRIPGLTGAAITAALNTIFTAAVSNAWETAANWNHGIPGSTSNAFIQANKLAIINSNNNQCNNLNISPLGKITINAAKDLMVNGILTLQSDTTGTASLINNGSLSSDSNNIERYIAVTNSNQFHQLSSPVNAQAINPVFSPLNESFYAWNETNGSWLPFEDLSFNTLNGSNNFTPGKGYAVTYNSTSTKTFAGNLNNGTIISNLSLTSGIYSGWNFIGNPYASAINWNIGSGFSRNMLDDAGSGQRAFWIWNPISGNYGTYISNGTSGTNGVSNFIASMQGFWVKASYSGNFSVNNSAREHSSQPWLKSNTAVENSIRLKLIAIENTFSDELIIRFGFPNDIGGAEKMFSMYSAAPGIYSTKLNKKWSINLLSSINNNAVIPIGFSSGVNGNYMITASDLSSFNSSTYVYLKDLATNTLIDLNQHSEYSFTSTSNENNNRFQLLFSTTPLGLSAINFQNPIIYAYDFCIYINCNEIIHNISIYNSLGQLIRSIEKTESIINMKEYDSGCYIVKVVTSKMVYTEKVLIK